MMSSSENQVFLPCKYVHIEYFCSLEDISCKKLAVSAMAIHFQHEHEVNQSSKHDSDFQDFVRNKPEEPILATFEMFICIFMLLLAKSHQKYIFQVCTVLQCLWITLGEPVCSSYNNGKGCMERNGELHQHYGQNLNLFNNLVSDQDLKLWIR